MEQLKFARSLELLRDWCHLRRNGHLARQWTSLVAIGLMALSLGCKPGSDPIASTQGGAGAKGGAEARGGAGQRGPEGGGARRGGRGRGPEPIVRGESYIVQQQVWPFSVRFQGSLVADEQTVVGAKVSGRLDQIYVDLGDRVRKDDPLLRLDQQDFRLLVTQAEAQLAQARADLGMAPSDSLDTLDPTKSPPVKEAFAIWNEARATVKRLEDLHRNQNVSDTELEQAQANERVTEARYQSAINTANAKIALIRVRESDLGIARQKLSDTTVYAPFDGVVQLRSVSPGTYVQAGQGLIAIVRTSPLRFRGSIPERYARQLKLDQTVELDIETSGEPVISKVSRISPSLDMQSRSLTFEAMVDNTDGHLRSGLFAEGHVVLDPKALVIAIPRSCSIRFAGVEKAWKIVGDRIMEQPLRIGREEDDRIEVLEGLKVGDEILLDAQAGKTGRFERVKKEENNSSRPDSNGEAEPNTLQAPEG